MLPGRPRRYPPRARSITAHRPAPARARRSPLADRWAPPVSRLPPPSGDRAGDDVHDRAVSGPIYAVISSRAPSYLYPSRPPPNPPPPKTLPLRRRAARNRARRRRHCRRAFSRAVSSELLERRRASPSLPHPFAHPLSPLARSIAQPNAENDLARRAPPPATISDEGRRGVSTPPPRHRPRLLLRIILVRTVRPGAAFSCGKRRVRRGRHCRRAFRRAFRRPARRLVRPGVPRRWILIQWI